MSGKTRKIVAGLLFLCLLLSLCACTIGLHAMTYDRTDNCYVDGRTGMVYMDAPGCYEPVAVGAEYACWRVQKGAKIIFHEVDGMDPTRWLCEEGKTVFYAQDEKLPSLREMAPEKIYLCMEESVALVVSEVTEAADIEAIIALWETAESISYTGAEPTLNLRLKFAGQAYPGLYYSLIYLEYGDGSRVIYDRSSGRCVEAGDVLAKYVGGEESAKDA